MKKAYEVTIKDGDKIRHVTAKGYTLIGSVYQLAHYPNVYENMICIKEISFERYHTLNVAHAIREADTWEECEEECVELCRLANMESEWREADDETFEAVIFEAAKKLNVEI